MLFVDVLRGRREHEREAFNGLTEPERHVVIEVLQFLSEFHGELPRLALAGYWSRITQT